MKTLKKHDMLNSGNFRKGDSSNTELLYRFSKSQQEVNQIRTKQINSLKFKIDQLEERIVVLEGSIKTLSK